MADNNKHQYPDFIETTGYGTGEGLCGWNCRHGFQPWDERLRYQEPKIDEKESKRRYELSQKQRAKERAIRKTKRQMLVKQEEIDAADGEEKEKLQAEYDELALKLTRQNADYNSFCKDNDLATQYDRLRLADYNRKSEKDAIEAFKKKSLQGEGNDDTIESNKVSGALNPYSSEADEHAVRYYESVRHMTTDCERIAKNTGYSTAEIQSIKNYVFVDKHDLGLGTAVRFDESYEMAQSWQRLIDGKNILEHDITLLKHETMESALVKQGMKQEEAHILASKNYNYAKEAAEYYDKIKRNN